MHTFARSLLRIESNEQVQLQAVFLESSRKVACGVETLQSLWVEFFLTEFAPAVDVRINPV